MKEAINKFYINNAKVENVNEWIDYDKTSVIYEVIKIIKGKPLFYDEHYKRMENSLKLKGEKIKVTYKEMLNMIIELVNENNAVNGNIKIIYNLKDENLRIFFIEHKYPSVDMYQDGVDTIIFFGERNNPNIKAMNVDFRDEVNKEIKKKNVYEAILVDNNGLITEGSRSNIFFIKENIVYTSKSDDVLPGVTRTEIFKEAKKSGIPIEETDIKLSELECYDAAFISGTSPNILPIRKIGDKKFDVENNLMRDLMKKFDMRIEGDIL